VTRGGRAPGRFAVRREAAFVRGALESGAPPLTPIQATVSGARRPLRPVGRRAGQHAPVATGEPVRRVTLGPAPWRNRPNAGVARGSHPA